MSLTIASLYSSYRLSNLIINFQERIQKFLILPI